MKQQIEIGDVVSDSGVGSGKITGFSERGFPMVNNVTCAWVKFEDRSVFDPYGVSDKHKAHHEPTP